jgi:septal ring factor EnvC (AmiA/AmiB activator)
MQERSSEDLDSDPTDQLPVLLETDVLDERMEPLLAVPRAEDTAEHTSLFSLEVEAGASEKLAELAERVEQIPALEAQIRTLTDGARDLEQRAAEKDRRLQDLHGKLAELQRSRDDAAAAERRLATQLAIRDARIAELTTTVQRLEQEATTGSAQLQLLRETAEAARGEAATLRQELQARPAPDPASPDTRQLREDHAALTAYIVGRRTWWDGLQADNTRLAARVAALEHELGQNAKRLASAESLAERESTRAVALRAELVGYARRVETLERALRDTEAPAAIREPESAPPQPQAPSSAEPGTSIGSVATADASPPQAPPILTDAVDAAAPAVEALAQLEGEVEYKRQQVAAQLVELRDREQRLLAMTNELEHARRELGTLRAELEVSRANAVRLERAVIDKDRALETRDARIATLHEELKQRAGAPMRAAGDLGSPNAVAAPSRTIAREADSMAAPALLCLTGDAPKRFPLTQSAITIGRGPDCDLQIVTHFVSREHARLTLHGGSAFIEDLGSRNGVFVNSVRVDRHSLQHGDLLTIGETQFRFVESMAH